MTVYTAINVYTILSAIPYSLTMWSGIGDKKYIGLDNYITLFTDQRMSKTFINALKNNVYLILIGILIIAPLIILIAYLIYRKIPGFNVLKTLIFTPHLVNFITMGFMVTLFMDPNIGMLSKLVHLLGIDWSPSSIIGGPFYGAPYISVVNAWKGMGYSMMIVVANFAMIPLELEEASAIDGAGEWQTFFHVHLPLLKPALTNIIIIHYIWGISVFEIPFVLGGLNGGIGGKLDVVGLFFYRIAFGSENLNNAMGMGTTIATIMFFLILVGAVAQLWILNKKEIDE